MMLVFGDESCDEKKERVFAVAGVVGTEKQWDWLEERWLICCDGTPFHAKDCESGYGNYRGRTSEQNKELYKALTIMLAASEMGGFGIALDLAAQKHVNPDALESLAYYKCFLELIQRMRNCAEYNKQIAKFTFDKRPEGVYNSSELYAIAQNTKDWNPFLDSEIGFACSKTNPRIQVADLFARETMKALDNMVGPTKRPVRKSMKCLSDTGRFHIDVYGEEWFRTLMPNMPKLEQQTGMSMADYKSWLVMTNRMTDNTSNRFAYIKYAIQRDGE